MAVNLDDNGLGRTGRNVFRRELNSPGFNHVGPELLLRSPLHPPDSCFPLRFSILFPQYTTCFP